MPPGDNVRLFNSIRWIIAFPATLFTVAVLRWFILRLDIALVVALDLPAEAAWTRLLLTFTSLGPCAFAVVLIPVILAPSRKRITAVAVAGVVAAIAAVHAIIALLAGDAWPIVEAATVIIVSAATAAALWRQYE